MSIRPGFSTAPLGRPFPGLPHDGFQNSSEKLLSMCHMLLMIRLPFSTCIKIGHIFKSPNVCFCCDCLVQHSTLIKAFLFVQLELSMSIGQYDMTHQKFLIKHCTGTSIETTGANKPKKTTNLIGLAFLLALCPSRLLEKLSFLKC